MNINKKFLESIVWTYLECPCLKNSGIIIRKMYEGNDQKEYNRIEEWMISGILVLKKF